MLLNNVLYDMYVQASLRQKGAHEQRRPLELSAFEIDPRQRVLFGVHLIRQIPKSGSRGIPESSKVSSALWPDHGNDLVLVSHHHDEFRRKDIRHL
jgi:hypothetical protein